MILLETVRQLGRILHDDFVRLVRAEKLEFLQHFVRRAEMGIRLALILQRTETRYAVNRNVAEYFLPRKQVMDVACGDDRLAQLLADSARFGAAPLPAPRGFRPSPLSSKMHVEIERLNLQHVVERRDFLRFLLRFVEHRLEQLAFLATGDDEQALREARSACSSECRRRGL